jgi:protein O-GlcNAc transferase
MGRDGAGVTAVANRAELNQLLAAAHEQHRAGNLAAAEKAYGEILRRQPRHAKTLHLLGVLALQTGRPEAAIELLERAARIEPEDHEIQRNLARALARAGRGEAATTALERAAALSPADALLRLELGNAYVKGGKNREAIAAY